MSKRQVMKGLTLRQFEARQYIARYIDEHGFAPSGAEIGAELGITVRGVFGLIERLEKRGHIVRERYSPRSFALVTA